MIGTGSEAVLTQRFLAPQSSPSSSAMPRTTSVSPHAEFLPAILELEGVKNVKEWKYSVRVYLNHHGLLDFIDGTHEKGQANTKVESGNSWHKRRAHAFTIINSKINKIMPMLLTAGLKAYDDDYGFDPQELWSYICRYITLDSECDSPKDRMLLRMFNPEEPIEDETHKTEYLYLRRLLRQDFGVEVHPKIMEGLGIDEDTIEEYETFYDKLATGHSFLFFGP